MVRFGADDETLGRKAVSIAGCSKANPPNAFGFDATIVHESLRVNRVGFSSCLIRSYFRLPSALPGRFRVRRDVNDDLNFTL
jgi:hypothetical protein